MLWGLLLGAVLTAAIGLSLQPSKGVEAWGYKIMLGVLFATGTACWASFGTLFVYPAPQTVALYFVGLVHLRYLSSKKIPASRKPYARGDLRLVLRIAGGGVAVGPQHTRRTVKATVSLLAHMLLAIMYDG